ncbi:MAG: cryptochrome/photolyase family protein [Betaproteobacteria bacterium]
MQAPYQRGLVWFRRDLRAEDHHAMHQALTHCRQVLCLFVLDREILDELPRADRRVDFIVGSLQALDARLRELGAAHGRQRAGLLVEHGWARQALPELAARWQVQAVFTNHDDEPQALGRDAEVAQALSQQGVAFHSFKDHVVFERQEVLTQAGRPYGVFTPYKNAWLKNLSDRHLSPWPVEPHAAALADRPEGPQARVPTLNDIGFEPTNLQQLGIVPGEKAATALLQDFLGRIDRYDKQRDFPAVKGPSYLSVHLRFGTISIRALASQAMRLQAAGSAGAMTWLSELIWRDFYAQILANFPHVAERAFKPEYDAIVWENGAQADLLFAAWCQGRTGYPLVDAAMAQLNSSGYMHNRLRMVTACFLIKDLGIDWRWGERYFARQLNDFDLASNNGGWQWASSSGCDAQPYFRIFNPVSQSRKFDAAGKFIRRYLPQLAGLSDTAIHAPWEAAPLELAAAGVQLGANYPGPVVAHDQARARTLDRYALVKKSG